MKRQFTACPWCGHPVEFDRVELCYDIDEIRLSHQSFVVHRHVNARMPNPADINVGMDGGRITFVGSYTLPEEERT